MRVATWCIGSVIRMALGAAVLLALDPLAPLAGEAARGDEPRSQPPRADAGRAGLTDGDLDPELTPGEVLLLERMEVFARSFRRIEDLMTAGETRRVATLAAEIAAAADGLGPALAAPRYAAAGAADLERYVTRVGGNALELARSARRGDVTATTQALAATRQQCVACHVKAYGAEYRSGIYPARRNVLGGRILVTRDGDPREQGSGNVVVFLEGPGLAEASLTPVTTPVLSQRDRQFSPRVLPVVEGTTVEFPNDDVIFHNVFSLSRIRPFDLDVYEPGKTKHVTFDSPGLAKVYCNIHPQMSASVLVLRNSFFDVTDPRGRFVISDIPDGHYTLRAWHELADEVQQAVQLTGNGFATVSIEVPLARRAPRPHRNKFGKPYKGKYH